MLVDQLPVLSYPNGEDKIQTHPVGHGEKGHLFTAPVQNSAVRNAVAHWLETHAISGVVFKVSGKRLILSPMD